MWTSYQAGYGKTDINWRWDTNLRCKRNNALPKSLQLNPPIISKEAFQIAKATGNKYLMCSIKDYYFRIRQWSKQMSEFRLRPIESILSPELFRSLSETADNKLKNKENSEREKPKDKFSKLIRNDAHIYYPPHIIIAVVYIFISFLSPYCGYRFKYLRK